MKKKIFLLALLASFGGSLQAQDTLWMKPAPLSNYFYNNWLDTTQGYGANSAYSIGRAMAKRFITEDTLQVYGIAAMMLDQKTRMEMIGESPAQISATFVNNGYTDTTLNNCEESLMLFQYRGNGTPEMQQLGDSLHVHALYTVPSHYVMSTMEANWRFTLDGCRKPLYERYFSEPQTVCDTFYTGWTENCMEFCKLGEGYGAGTYVLRPTRPIFHCMSYISAPDLSVYGHVEALAILRQNSPDSACRWEFKVQMVIYTGVILSFLFLPPNQKSTPRL